MTRMTRPDCAVMCNLINTHTHTHIYACVFRVLSVFYVCFSSPVILLLIVTPVFAVVGV